jgi:hypothetical protein
VSGNLCYSPIIRPLDPVGILSGSGPETFPNPEPTFPLSRGLILIMIGNSILKLQFIQHFIQKIDCQTLITSALPAPLAMKAKWCAAFSTGIVRVIRRGGDFGEQFKWATQTEGSCRSRWPGKSEQVCPSGPRPRKSRSNMGKPAESSGGSRARNWPSNCWAAWAPSARSSLGTRRTRLSNCGGSKRRNVPALLSPSDNGTSRSSTGKSRSRLRT